MSDSSLKKLSRVNAELFKIYLDFCPNYRRTLINLNKMVEWLKELELDKEFSSFEVHSLYNEVLFKGGMK